MRALLLLSLFIATASSGQIIPNGDFETWFVDIWQPEPEGWSTSNGQLIPAVVQDLDSYEGEYAMRVMASSNSIGYSFAETFFTTNVIPASLDFYVKALVEAGGVNVIITFLNNEQTVYTESWINVENIDEWTYMSLPLQQDDPIITHANIKVEAYASDVFPGDAWISVDAMGFDGPLNSENEEGIQFEVFPNPTTETFHISGEVSGSLFSLFDLTGKVIRTSILTADFNSIDIQNLPQGLYLVEVKSPQGARVSQKLVKR